MKTIKAKNKPKKSSGKFRRMKFENKNSSFETNPDLTQLRKPVDLSVSSLLQVSKLLSIGSEEVKGILVYECDIVYECRVCRSLFRSLANLISHKRVYCKEKCNLTRYRDCIKYDYTVQDKSSLNSLHENIDDILKEADNARVLRSQTPKVSGVPNGPDKDLTSIVDAIQQQQNEDSNDNVLPTPINEKTGKNSISNSDCMLLEEVESNCVAMYQTMVKPLEANGQITSDNMKTQISELQEMMNQSTAILGTDGRILEANYVEKSDNPLQCCMDNEISNESVNTQNLVCSICKAKFATKKTLTFHMKSLHVSNRMCYPCPCCSSTFANTWSVYRHLFKVHRKTNEQVRKLRVHIQEKAFRKESTGAEDLEKQCVLDTALDSLPLAATDDTQEWMKHLELDLELQRCGGCGRRFDRKVALQSHSQRCQRRIDACNGAANKVKKIVKPLLQSVHKNDKPLVEEVVNQVAMRNDNVAKATAEKSQLETEETKTQIAPDKANKVLSAGSDDGNELPIRVQNVSSLSNDAWERMGANSPLLNSTSHSSSESSVVDTICDEKATMHRQQSSPISDLSDSPEIIYTSIDRSNTMSLAFGNKKRKIMSTTKNERLHAIADKIGERNLALQNTLLNVNRSKPQSTFDYTLIMEKKMAAISNIRKLQCLPCRQKFTSMANLRRHMAIHIGWNRYRCKLCPFKCFVKCDCVAHCNRLHNAKNNRSVISEMVLEMPEKEILLNAGINVENGRADVEPEIIDVTSSTMQTVSAETNNTFGIESSIDKSALDVLIDEPACANDARNDINETVHTEEVEKEQENMSVSNDTVESNTDNPKDPEKDSEDPNKKKIAESTQAHRNLYTDPDLRRMVMEVIFGSSDSNSNKQSAENKTVHEVNGHEKTSSQDEEKSKEADEFSETGGTKEENVSKNTDVRPQRPVRNRVKPVDKDFIYDLKELDFRNNVSLSKGAVVSTNRSVEKKSPNRLDVQDKKHDIEITESQPVKISKSLYERMCLGKVSGDTDKRTKDVAEKIGKDASKKDRFVVAGNGINEVFVSDE
ncbi:uncharacterized protein LOC105694899 isoform X2 [Orussus abietinus]|nr:uncharacterized protein LOC105694899 isoform X2 [Orussus abietinus]XP_012271462.1 uncharacterized protein LOC105694899 isoform X2 [Orussus abietinus]